MANAGFVGTCETFPEAGPLCLSVAESEGEYANKFCPRYAEVTLLGPKTDAGTLIVSLRFDTFEQAGRAGNILAEAFASVRAIQAEPTPEPCRSHAFRIRRFARELEQMATCDDCCEVFDLVQRHDDEAGV